MLFGRSEHRQHPAAVKADGPAFVHAVKIFHAPAVGARPCLSVVSYYGSKLIFLGRQLLAGGPLVRVRSSVHASGRRKGRTVRAAVAHPGRDPGPLGGNHARLIRPAGYDQLDRIAALWRVYDEFPFKDAKLYPYWNNADVVKCEPTGVYATAYQRPAKGC